MEFVELTLIDGSKEYLECGNFMKDLEETTKKFKLLTLICESGNMVPYHAIVKWRISKDKPFKTIGSRITRDGDSFVKTDIQAQADNKSDAVKLRESITNLIRSLDKKD